MRVDPTDKGAGYFQPLKQSTLLAV